jgi:hypothetical protein
MKGANVLDQRHGRGIVNMPGLLCGLTALTHLAITNWPQVWFS